MAKPVNKHDGEHSIIGGRLLILAAMEIVVVVLLAQHLYPNYSLNYNYISDLGVGSTAAIFNPGIIVFGAILAFAAYFLFTARKHRYMAIGFLVMGLGAMGVGLFPETTGWPHLLCAFITFGSAAVLALAYSRIFKGWTAVYSFVAGVVALFMLFGFSFVLTGAHAIPGLGHGGIEEILFYDEIIWALVVGLYVATRRI